MVKNLKVVLLIYQTFKNINMIIDENLTNVLILEMIVYKILNYLKYLNYLQGATLFLTN